MERAVIQRSGEEGACSCCRRQEALPRSRGYGAGGRKRCRASMALLLQEGRGLAEVTRLETFSGAVCNLVSVGDRLTDKMAVVHGL